MKSLTFALVCCSFLISLLSAWLVVRTTVVASGC